MIVKDADILVAGDQVLIVESLALFDDDEYHTDRITFSVWDHGTGRPFVVQSG